MMTRRTFFALGAAAGAMVAAGAALLAGGYRNWVVASLREALPGYAFEPAGLDRFVADYESRHGERMKFRLLGAAERVRDLIRAPVPRAVREEYEAFRQTVQALLGEALHATSLSRKRCSLPVWVRGSASTKTRVRGYL